MNMPASMKCTSWRPVLCQCQVVVRYMIFCWMGVALSFNCRHGMFDRWQLLGVDSCLVAFTGWFFNGDGHVVTVI